MEGLTSPPPRRPPRSLAGRLAVALATAGGVGYIPFAPGTFGTAVAVPLAWLASGAPQWGYLALCLAVTGLAIWAAAGADRAFGVHDSGRIVIDEVAGYLWTMALVDRSDPLLLLAGFVLFRLADIVKPPPARAIDARMEGGTGVVLDDVVAGLWAAAALF
ncbi:MAG TPA: phosphatidylglycerophosphatase A, partial [Kofleriaceae bacterium]|nr:phosphatidylglycerophosphatase A [Kofleriaceae bacterium]